jgi:hypothetical protein
MSCLSHELRTSRVAVGTFCLYVLTILCGAMIAAQADTAPTQKTINVGTRTVKLTLARPTADAPPPAFLVVFASGDGGLRGVSKALLVHLSEQNYWVAGFSSPEAFKGSPTTQKGSRTTQAPGIASCRSSPRRSRPWGCPNRHPS